MAHGRHRLSRSWRSTHSWWSILRLLLLRHGWLAWNHRIRWHSGLLLRRLLVPVGKAVAWNRWSAHTRLLVGWWRTILKRWLTWLLLLRRKTARHAGWWGNRSGRRATNHRLVRERSLVVLRWGTTKRHVLELVGKVLRSPIDGWRWRYCLSYALLWPPLGRLPVRTHLGIHYQLTILGVILI